MTSQTLTHRLISIAYETKSKVPAIWRILRTRHSLDTKIIWPRTSDIQFVIQYHPNPYFLDKVWLQSMILAHEWKTWVNQVVTARWVLNECQASRTQVLIIIQNFHECLPWQVHLINLPLDTRYEVKQKPNSVYSFHHQSVAHELTSYEVWIWLVTNHCLSWRLLVLRCQE